MEVPAKVQIVQKNCIVFVGVFFSRPSKMQDIDVLAAVT